MCYVDDRHGPGPLRTDATFATTVLPQMLNGSMHAFGELAHKDTVLAYLQLVLRQAAGELPAALAE